MGNDRELIFGNAGFQMSIRHLSRDVKKALGIHFWSSVKESGLEIHIGM